MNDKQLAIILKIGLFFSVAIASMSLGHIVAVRMFQRSAVEAGVGEYRIKDNRKVFYFKDLQDSSTTISLEELLEEENQFPTEDCHMKKIKLLEEIEQSKEF